ncbi:Sec-independent protein translocase subunit TatA/TatB [Halocalculus aciditolerans]|uniref:Twin-arginine translocase TatA/TatE family subunit n=1 Tax=Halocalculus aciditolerans TaxID=1383812 RepID=A0A830FIM9_9EURY|nr:twin-arginine translocase TatA/TatE family subunit [Halocalculus aciditolerans]GGL58750.1 twin-arginine translocase TatA/TatE family subunit [Halocalculus aciditolerans]
MFTTAPLFAGLPGGMELAVILLIAVLLFGANKIPKLARSTGQAMGEFQKGRQELEQEIDEMKDPDNADTEASSVDADADTTSKNE